MNTATVLREKHAPDQASEYMRGLDVDSIVYPEIHEDVPVFRNRRQWKRHLVAVHNAKYLDSKANPVSRNEIIREVVIDTVDGFQKGLGI
jgi:hypothetical protein